MDKSNFDENSSYDARSDRSGSYSVSIAKAAS